MCYFTFDEATQSGNCEHFLAYEGIFSLIRRLLKRLRQTKNGSFSPKMTTVGGGLLFGEVFTVTESTFAFWRRFSSQKI